MQLENYAGVVLLLFLWDAGWPSDFIHLGSISLTGGGKKRWAKKKENTVFSAPNVAEATCAVTRRSALWRLAAWFSGSDSRFSISLYLCDNWCHQWTRFKLKKTDQSPADVSSRGVRVLACVCASMWDDWRVDAAWPGRLFLPLQLTLWTHHGLREGKNDSPRRDASAWISASQMLAAWSWTQLWGFKSTWNTCACDCKCDWFKNNNLKDQKKKNKKVTQVKCRCPCVFWTPCPLLGDHTIRRCVFQPCLLIHSCVCVLVWRLTFPPTADNRHAGAGCVHRRSRVPAVWLQSRSDQRTQEGTGVLSPPPSYMWLL